MAAPIVGRSGARRGGSGTVLWHARGVAESETLGVLAHRGGLVVERPELSVGVVRAVSRPRGLEVELLARRPLDRRSATERQADIRAGRGVAPASPRRLLPRFDEGTDLRVGWLDHDGQPHWEFGSLSSNSGDAAGGTLGPSLRTVLDLPPLFDHVSLVLAWPEIGFPETVVGLTLPDRATVERDTVSIWRAPLDALRAPKLRIRSFAAFPPGDVAPEAGRIVAGPRVLSRGDRAVVVLTRLTAVGPALSMEVLSVAEEHVADAVAAAELDPGGGSFGGFDAPVGPGASVAVVGDGGGAWLPVLEGQSASGAGAYRGTAEFLLSRPDDDVLALVVAWPAADLPDVRLDIPLPFVAP